MKCVKKVKKKSIVIFSLIMLALLLVLSACYKPIEPSINPSPSPSMDVTIEPSPKASPSLEPSPTPTPTPTPSLEPSVEPSPSPTLPPKGEYIEYLDAYVDFEEAKAMSKDIIYWNKNSPPIETLDKHGAITHGDKQKKEMYLTFNLGYEHVAGNTERMLDILKERNIKATFFMVGEYIEVFPQKVRAIYEDGHTLGGHTYYHFPPTYTMTEEELIEDFVKTEELLEIALGDKYEKMKYFRPIASEFNERDIYVAKSLGYTTVLFDATYDDWNRTITHGFDYAYSQLKKDIKQGAIYQLHIVTPDNIEALPVFIDELLADGWVFKTFD